MQLSYNQYMGVAFAGMKVDSMDDHVESFSVEDGPIGVGLAVIAGTDPARQVALAGTAGGKFRGVTLFPGTLTQDADGVVAYPDKATASVLRKGKVWVPVTAAVAIDGVAFFDNGSTPGSEGQFNSVDDGTTDAVPGGVFRTSTSGAGLAVLELNLP